jgi:hypothetical protein
LTTDFQLTGINRGAKFYPNQGTETGIIQKKSQRNDEEKAHFPDQTPPLILSATTISAKTVNVAL